jgi:predicted Zn-dependent protease
MNRVVALLGLAYSSTVLIASPVDDFAGGVGCLHSAATKVSENQQCRDLAKRPISFEEEKSFGGAVAVGLVGSAGLLIDEPSVPASPKNIANHYVVVVGRNIASISERPIFPWTFAILDEPAGQGQVNAFSAPAGYVFINKSLLQRVENEAQLAGVLAHEVAHVTRQHAIHEYQEIRASQCDAALGGSLVGDAAYQSGILDGMRRLVSIPSTGFITFDVDVNFKVLDLLTDKVVEQVVESGYGQSHEYEADRAAVELMLVAGYNPEEFIQFVGKLPDGPGVFKNHPSPSARVEAMHKEIGRYCADTHSPLLGDCPFKSYPVVPLPPDVKAAIAKL